MTRTTTARLAAGLVVTMTCGVLAAGCTYDDTATIARGPVRPPVEVEPGDFEPTSDDYDAITRLLAARASAALSGNQKAFLATVDPKQPKLVKQQRTLFGNLDRLDLTRMSYLVDRETLVVAASVPGEAPTFRPLITEHIELAGTLDQPVVNAVQMTFVRRASGWYLGAENERKRTTSMESPQERPWFGGPIAVRRDGPMTVLVDRKRADSLDGLMSSVHDDIEYAADVLDVEPAYDVLVDATSNGLTIDFSKLTKEEVAAFSFGLYGRNGRVGSAIKLNPERVEESLDQENLMRHELTHYLLHKYDTAAPTWLVEGVAMYVETYPGDMSRYVVDDKVWDRLQAADHDLPGVGTFDIDPSTNYFISWAAVVRLVNRAGIDDLERLMKEYLKAYDGPDVDALTPRLLRKVYGLREQDLVDQAFDEMAELHH